MKDGVDPMEYAVEEGSTNTVNVYVESNKINARQCLCMIDTRNGKIIQLDMLRGGELTVKQICKRIKVLDSALRELNFEGIVVDSELEERVARLEDNLEDH